MDYSKCVHYSNVPSAKFYGNFKFLGHNFNKQLDNMTCVGLHFKPETLILNKLPQVPVILKSTHFYTICYLCLLVLRKVNKLYTSVTCLLCLDYQLALKLGIMDINQLGYQIYKILPKTQIKNWNPVQLTETRLFGDHFLVQYYTYQKQLWNV